MTHTLHPGFDEIGAGTIDIVLFFCYIAFTSIKLINRFARSTK